MKYCVKTAAELTQYYYDKKDCDWSDRAQFNKIQVISGADFQFFVVKGRDEVIAAFKESCDAHFLANILNGYAKQVRYTERFSD